MAAISLSSVVVDTYPALLGYPQENGRVHCALCPHDCHLPPGSIGLCGVRANQEGVLISLSYGWIVAAASEPIEKKPLFHFYPGHQTFSLGARGCNLRCKFCQNWEISQTRTLWGKRFSPEDAVTSALTANCDSICFTFTEPIVNLEYVLDVARLSQAEGLKVILLTGGYVSRQGLELLLPSIDAIKVDLKAPTESQYRDVAGGSAIPVWETVRSIAESDVWLELSVVLLPILYQMPDAITLLTERILQVCGAEVPLHFMRFFPNFEMVDSPPGTIADAMTAVDRARLAGLSFAYLSNLPGHAYSSTLCSNCGLAVITRAVRASVKSSLHLGLCPNCQTVVPGHWNHTG